MSVKSIIEKTAGGELTLKVEKEGKILYLHSGRNPRRDEEIFATALNPEKYDVVIFLGAGLGYHLTPLEEKLSQFKNIFIIDYLNDFGIPEGSTLFKITGSPHGNVFLFRGLPVRKVSASIEKELDFDKCRGIQILEHPASVRIFGAYFSEIKNELKYLMDKKAGSLASKTAFGRQYLRNALLNLREIGKCKGVQSLKGIMKGGTAAVVASGPTLSENISYLKKNRERCTIVVADSALSALKCRGIEPDIVLCVDPQAAVMEHLRALPGDTIVIVSITCHWKAVKYCVDTVGHEQVFVSLNSHPVAQLLEELFPDRIGSVDSGTGSVAGDALYASHYLGADNSVMFALDSSFPNFEVYDRGTVYQYRWGQQFCGRTATLETRNLNYIFSGKRRQTEKGLYTRQSFLDYAAALARFAGDKGIDGLFTMKSSGMPLENVEDIDYDILKKMSRTTSLKKREMMQLSCKSLKIEELVDYIKIYRILLEEEYRNRVFDASGVPEKREGMKQLILRAARSRGV